LPGKDGTDGKQGEPGKDGLPGHNGPTGPQVQLGTATAYATCMADSAQRAPNPPNQRSTRNAINSVHGGKTLACPMRGWLRGFDVLSLAAGRRRDALPCCSHKR
jgi:hypothetical protein